MKSMKQKIGYPDFILDNKEMNERYEGVRFYLCHFSQMSLHKNSVLTQMTQLTQHVYAYINQKVNPLRSIHFISHYFK